MPTHIALLRGVNLGKAKRIGMADLRAIAEGLGWERPRTLLNSGNLVFEAAPASDHAARMERALADQLGLQVRVTVLSVQELAAVVAATPFTEEVLLHPSKVLVTFPITSEALTALAPLAKADWSPERLAVTKLAAFSWHPDGLSGGKLAEALDRAGRSQVTARNWATVLKLQAATQPA